MPVAVCVNVPSITWNVPVPVQPSVMVIRPELVRMLSLPPLCRSIGPSMVPEFVMTLSLPFTASAAPRPGMKPVTRIVPVLVKRSLSPRNTAIEPQPMPVTSPELRTVLPVPNDVSMPVPHSPTLIEPVLVTVLPSPWLRMPQAPGPPMIWPLLVTVSFVAPPSTMPAPLSPTEIRPLLVTTLPLPLVETPTPPWPLKIDPLFSTVTLAPSEMPAPTSDEKIVPVLVMVPVSPVRMPASPSPTEMPPWLRMVKLLPTSMAPRPVVPTSAPPWTVTLRLLPPVKPSGELPEQVTTSPTCTQSARAGAAGPNTASSASSDKTLVRNPTTPNTPAQFRARRRPASTGAVYQSNRVVSCPRTGSAIACSRLCAPFHSDGGRTAPSLPTWSMPQ